VKNKGVCRCRLLADSIDIKNAITLMGDETLSVDRDFSFFLIIRESGIYVIFDFGVVVEWGDILENELLAIVAKNEQTTLPSIDFEYLHYDFTAKTRAIDDDVILLPEDDEFQTIVAAYSFAIAQAHKLSVYESLISKTIEQSIHIPKDLAENGEINLSSKKTAKLRGELFLIKSDINLGFELLDTPNYFWEHPNEMKYYKEMTNYLELDQRMSILNKKINVVSEILEMLSDEQKHQDSSFLERVIIFLILFEVIIFLFHDVLKLF